MLKKIVGIILTFSLAVAVMLSFASCQFPGFGNNDDDTPCTHRDADDNGKCDTCGEDFTDGDETPAPTCEHRDADDNGKCDKCGEDFSDGNEAPPAPTEVAHTITVVDANGNAVAGAVVKFVLPNGSAVEKTTDAEGKASANFLADSGVQAQIKTVPNGYYVEDFAKVNFTDAAATITVANATYVFEVADTEGELYAGVIVSLYAYVDGVIADEPVAFAETDDFGVCYVVLPDGAGVYAVVVTLPEGDNRYVADFDTAADGFKYEVEILPELGSEGNPIALEGIKENLITVNPGETKWYTLEVFEGFDRVFAYVNYGVATLTIGETAYVITPSEDALIEDVTEAGVITFSLSVAEAADSEAEVAVCVDYAYGTVYSPEGLWMGSTITMWASEADYYYTWTAPYDGTLTFTLGEDAGSFAIIVDDEALLPTGGVLELDVVKYTEYIIVASGAADFDVAVEGEADFVVYVLAENRAPVANAEVSIFDALDDMAPVATVTTDENGMASASLDAFGIYYATADFVGYYVEDAYFSEGEASVLKIPYMLPNLDEQNLGYYTVTIPAGATYYFNMVTNETLDLIISGDVKLVIDGEEYEAVDGEILYQILVEAASGNPADRGGAGKTPFQLVNEGTEAVEVTVAWEYLAGSINNPIVAANGEATKNVAVGEEVFFKYNATTAKQIITVTVSENAALNEGNGRWVIAEGGKSMSAKLYDLEYLNEVRFSITLAEGATAAADVTYTIAIVDVPATEITAAGDVTATIAAGEKVFYTYTAPYNVTLTFTAGENVEIYNAEDYVMFESAVLESVVLEKGDVLVFLVQDSMSKAGDATFSVAIAANICAEHDWNEGEITTAPDCENDGVKTFTCDACGATKTEDIKTEGHKYENKAGKDATCTEDGYTAYTECSVCHDIQGKKVIAHSGHVLDEDDVDVETAPDCTTPGFGYGTCKVCGEHFGDGVEIPALGHSGEWTIDTEATCTEDGAKHRVCTVCGVTEEAVIEALDHDLKDVVALDPDCENDGYTAHKACSRCDYTEDKEIIPALGHDYAWTVTTAATCIDNGSKHGVCATCQGETDVILYADGHKYTTSVDAADANYEYVTCGVCEHVQYREKVNSIGFNSGVLKDSAKLTYTIGALTGTGDAIVEPGAVSTEAGNGWTKYSIAEDAGNKVLKLVNINAGSENYAATQLKIGLTDPIRDKTTDKYLVFNTDIKIDYSAESYAVDSWNCVFRIALIDNGGNKPLHTDLCIVNDTLRMAYNENAGIELDPENPQWVSIKVVYELGTELAEDNLYHGKLYAFAKLKDANDDWTLLFTKEGTSTYTLTVDRGNYYIGLYQEKYGNYFADCELYLDNISFIATADDNDLYTACSRTNLSAWNVIKTGCDGTDGERERHCLDDGCLYEERETIVGHVVDEWTYVPADCTTAGSKSGTCVHCGENFTTETPALGHTEGEWTTVTEATCYSDGLKTTECSVCHETIEEVIPAFGHTFGAWENADDVNSEKRSCEVCGRYQLREKDNTINFENGAIIDANNKLSVTVGALTGTGDAAVSSGAGLTAFGNGSLSFSLVEEAGNKVLKVLQSKNANYAATTGGIAHTDATRSTADKYVVTEFDIKVNKGSSSTRELFRLTMSDSGNNQIYQVIFQTYGANFKIDNATMIDEAGADGATWFTIRIVSTLATEKTGDNYISTHSLYAKVRDAEGPMNFVKTYTKSSTYTGHTERSGAYKLVLAEGTGENHTFFLDNISFIRTSDANYTYSTCAHANMSAWTVGTEPDCDTNGVATRTCLADGCGYTETEYIPALGHELSAWTDAANNTEERACADCDYVISRVKNENAVQFDDGTIVGDGNIAVSLITTVKDDLPVEGAYAIEEGDTEGGNPYVWYSVVAAPDRLGENALKVQTVVSKYVEPYKGPRLDVTPMNEEAAGNVYTLDFDMYVEAAEITSSSRVFTQVAFGGHTLSFCTYGANVRVYGTSINVVAIDNWVSLRMVYKVTADGAADLEIFVKDADGVYQSIYTNSITATGIKLDGTGMYFSSYSSGMDHTYYLDNIYFTRTAAAAE